ncbi:LAFE_0G07822g1_1 [Lachancea fermentati]|uniref:LAFE_0G07822g1_1 n=1 Tax=Lachancea fermentati TaxID=4955 RepID=A0A1G4MHC2_LACFM|nr:LAFE_0G07822g1_1 [Lachancea fermentati]
MPRKFLGEHINLHSDFLRPASFTLTDLDLLQIPDTPDFDDHGSGQEQEDVQDTKNLKGKRISRQFGGTIKLKKRLSSVPDLFLRDLDHLQKNVGIKLSRRPPPVLVEQSRSPLPSVSERTEVSADNSSTKRQLHPSIARASNKYIPSPLSKPPSFNFSHNYMVYPLVEQVDSHQRADLMENLQSNGMVSSQKLTEQHSHHKSEGEIIYDQILKAYMSLPEKERPSSSLLKNELERSIGRHFEPNGSLSAFKRTKCSRGFGSFPQRGCFTDKNIDAKATYPGEKELNEILPDAEYSNSSGSEPFSSGEEFSDLCSIVSSLVQSSPQKSSDDDEVYYSANESCSRLQLQKSNTDEEKISIRRLNMVRISPRLIQIDDMVSVLEEEDNDRLEIQSEIDDLIIADNSSSVYETEQE